MSKCVVEEKLVEWRHKLPSFAGYFKVGAMLPTKIVQMLADNRLGGVSMSLKRRLESHFPNLDVLKSRSKSIQAPSSDARHEISQEKFHQAASILSELRIAIRSNVPPSVAGRLEHDCDSLLEWTCGAAASLSSRPDTLERRSKFQRFKSSPEDQDRYKSTFLINCLVLSGMICNDSNMRDVVEQSIKTVFSSSLAASLLKLLDSVKVPSASTMHRARFQVDVGLMLLSQSCFKELLDSCTAFSCYALCDSSPQGGRDWLLTTLHSLHTSIGVGESWRLGSKVFSLVTGGASELRGPTPEELNDMHTWLQQLRKILVCSNVPPASLGSHRSGLSHKVHAFTHSLMLEVGDSQALKKWLPNLVSLTTDFGTESKIATDRSWPMDELFPHAVGLECDVEGARRDDSHLELSYRDTLHIPGALHILHNIAADITGVMTSFPVMKPKLQGISNILSQKQYRDAIAAGLFGDVGSEAIAHQVKTFRDTIVDWRWASLSAFVTSLLPLEGAFLRYWSLPSVVGHAKLRKQSDDDGHVRLQLFDASIKDPYVWAYCKMLKQLMSVIDHLMHWSEACPCHSGLSGGPLNEWMCSNCPLKGRRGPEMASGSLQKVLNQHVKMRSVSLLPELTSIANQDREAILRDFNDASSHLVFFFE